MADLTGFEIRDGLDPSHVDQLVSLYGEHGGRQAEAAWKVEPKLAASDVVFAVVEVDADRLVGSGASSSSVSPIWSRSIDAGDSMTRSGARR